MEHIPILGVAGWSGSGKTTLIEASGAAPPGPAAGGY